MRNIYTARVWDGSHQPYTFYVHAPNSQQALDAAWWHAKDTNDDVFRVGVSLGGVAHARHCLLGNGHPHPDGGYDVCVDADAEVYLFVPGHRTHKSLSIPPLPTS